VKYGLFGIDMMNVIFIQVKHLSDIELYDRKIALKIELFFYRFLNLPNVN
jgi:ribosomal protein L29